MRVETKRRRTHIWEGAVLVRRRRRDSCRERADPADVLSLRLQPLHRCGCSPRQPRMMKNSSVGAGSEGLPQVVRRMERHPTQGSGTTKGGVACEASGMA